MNGKNLAFTARGLDNGMAVLSVVPHYLNCPVKMKQRMIAGCPWCQLERGKSVRTVYPLFGGELCERHYRGGSQFHFRGKAYDWKRESLQTMWRAVVHDERVKATRAKRTTRRAAGISKLEGFAG